MSDDTKPTEMTSKPRRKQNFVMPSGRFLALYVTHLQRGTMYWDTFERACEEHFSFDESVQRDAPKDNLFRNEVNRGALFKRTAVRAKLARENKKMADNEETGGQSLVMLKNRPKVEIDYASILKKLKGVKGAIVAAPEAKEPEVKPSE
jgi:hypothetical protein